MKKIRKIQRQIWMICKEIPQSVDRKALKKEEIKEGWPKRKH